MLLKFLTIKKLFTAWKNSSRHKIGHFELIICLISLPAQARYSGGTGGPNDPYQIATAQDLINLGNNPNYYDKHFILTDDIDLDPNLPGGMVFDKAVIAPDTNDVRRAFQGPEFAGIFDGNGHVISNLHIKGNEYLGLFGRLDSTAKIFNLGLEAVNISGTGSDIGSLTGVNSGNVSNCYSTGAVSGNHGVGGLIGDNWGNINMCYSNANVSGITSVSGLVGFHDNRGASISSSFSTGTVTGDQYVGGLVGFNAGPVINCYSNSTVNGRSTAGGLVGLNYIDGDIHKCYSTGKVLGTSYIGGLFGYTEGKVANSVWDIEVSGQAESYGCVGLTTAEMMDPDMFGLNGFANDPNWVMNPGLDYPRLAWEDTPGQIIPEPEIDWLEGDGTTEQPYRIISASQLILLGKASILWDKSFVLDADIDLDPNLPGRQVFERAVIPKFRGIFDGNDHVISNLTITGKTYLGLFSQLDFTTEVKNLGIEDANITGTDCLGSLAAINKGSINTCHSTVEVNGNNGVGGLVCDNEGYITMCYSNGTVTGNRSVGGLAGSNANNNISEGITASYSTVKVSGTYLVGGLVGGNGGNLGGNITTCYSTGEVNGDWAVGGLVGENSAGGDGGDITNCYSTGVVTGNEDGGGLVGINSSLGRITSCIWDMETSGLLNICGINYGDTTCCDDSFGKTTAEMQDPNTFMAAGWDFVGKPDGPHDIWIESESGGYPILWWQSPSGFVQPVFAGGDGEPNDPYLISTAEQLNSIGYNPRLMESHFKIIDNIDAANLRFYPIGNGNIPYRGVFDGNGHTVSNLTIEGQSYLGLFGALEQGAEVKNVGVADVNVIGSGDYIGGLAGLNGGDISNCFSTGTVIGESRYIGGLVGSNYKGTIINNYSNCSVTGDSYIGGLVGYNDEGEIFMCYSSGAVNIDSDVCGLVGRNSWNGIIAFSFWDIDTSGQNGSYGGLGRNTIEMQTKSNFTNAGWDFVDETANGTDDIWWIDEGKDYPRLWWEPILE